jgi:TonB-linked SusC/RagA family outer membrane protein
MRVRSCWRFLAFLLLGFPAGLAAQGRPLTGTVTRADGGSPIVEAIITVIGQPGAVKSDVRGHFSLTVPDGPVRLMVRAVAYKRQEIAVAADQGDVSVVMQQDVFKLDELVVTGQATEGERRNSTTSTAIIDGQDVNQVQAQSVDRALQGKIAGANIQTNSGAPGAGVQVQIRGTHTIIGSAEPLIVVDGVLYSNASVPSGLSSITGSSSNVQNGDAQDDATNRLADLNPNDIESIEVLKSAAAGSIYGSRAANGVIVVHTRRGQAGSVRANLSQRIGFSELLRGPDPRVFDTTQAFALYDTALVRSFLVNGKLPAYDHLRELAGNKPLSYESQLDVSGGTEKTRFFASAGWKKDRGIIDNTGSDRQTIRANITQQLTDRLSMDLTNAFVRNANDKGFTNNDNNGASVTYALAYIPSFIPLTKTNGIYPQPAITYFASNPLQTAALARNDETSIRYTGGATLKWDAWSNDRQSLRFVAGGGADFFSQKNKIIAPPELFFEQTLTNPGTITIGNADGRNLNWNLNAIHSYAPGSQSYRATTSLGTQYEDQQLNRNRLTARGILPGQTNIDQGSVLANNLEDRTTVRTLAFYGQEEVLMLRERLNLLGGFRAERSSVFGDASKYFLYPRISASYRFPGSLGNGSDLKLRVAYGQTGNQPRFGQKFTPVSGGQTYGGSGGTTVGTTSGDPKIKPERVTEIEGGVDADLGGGRANLQFTVARNVTHDLLLSRTPAASSGFNEEFINGGSMRNVSIELAAGVVPIQTPTFSWVARTTFTRTRNLVLSLPVPGFRPRTAGFGLAFGEFFVEEGKSATQIIGTVGYDSLGNPIIKQLGDANPDFRLTLTNDLTYKNVFLSVLWDWQQGGAAQNQTLSLYDCNQLSSDQATPAGQKRANACLQDGVATPFVESTTFLKLREVTLGWNLPQRLVRSLFAGAESARVSLSGRNLLLFTGYHLYDPESSNFGQQAITRNIDLGPYPPSRNFSFNVSVGF